MEHLQYAVPTLFGLEGLCADEMRRLGLDRVQAENGRVLCQGSGEDLARLNLNLRTGERVLLVLGSFPVGGGDAIDKLFEGTKALPWEQFIPREGQFPVKGHCLNSQLHSVPTCQAMIKKAVAARLGETGRVLVRESGTEPVLRVMAEAPEDTICRECVTQIVDVIRQKGHCIS